MTNDEGRLVLASASPRRRDLLTLLRLPHHVRPADIEEIRAEGETPEHFAGRAARDKALHVAAGADLPVLAADTVVAVEGECLGKPKDRAQAAAMLRRLSGREHKVHTGVALASGSTCTGLVDTATVRFAELNEAVISWYLQTEEPMDKAGAYAVQGRGGMLVTAVVGSPHTVVGLPIHRLPELFAAIDLNLWDFLL